MSNTIISERILKANSNSNYKNFSILKYSRQVKYTDLMSLIDNSLLFINKNNNIIKYLYPVDLFNYIQYAKKVKISHIIELPIVYQKLETEYYKYKNMKGRTIIIGGGESFNLSDKLFYKNLKGIISYNILGQTMSLSTNKIFDSTYKDKKYINIIFYDDNGNILMNKIIKGSDKFSDSMIKDIKDGYKIKILFADLKIFKYFKFYNNNDEFVDLNMAHETSNKDFPYSSSFYFNNGELVNQNL